MRTLRLPAVLLLGALALAASAQLAKRPIAPSQFESEFAKLSGISLRYPYSKEVSRLTWTASDSRLLKLAKEGKAEVREAAVGEAASRKRMACFPVLAYGLSTGNGPEGMAAVAGLSALAGSAEVRGALAGALKHRERRVSQAAALVLGGMKDKRSVPVLITMLDSDSLMMFRSSALLGWMGAKEAIPAMKKAEARRSGGSRGSDPFAAWAKATIPVHRLLAGDKTALEVLRPWFQGTRLKAMDMVHPQQAALDAIGTTLGIQEFETFVSALQGSGAVRDRARQWLAYFGDKRAVPWLRAASKTLPPDVENAGWFRTIPQRMLATATEIEAGKKGPRPKGKPPQFPNNGWLR
jgi:hypothetical protein